MIYEIDYFSLVTPYIANLSQISFIPQFKFILKILVVGLIYAAADLSAPEPRFTQPSSGSTKLLG